MCETCEQSKQLIEEWIAKQGHEACWYYPEIFTQIAALHGVTVATQPTMPRSVFEGGCARYHDELYGPRDIEDFSPDELIETLFGHYEHACFASMACEGDRQLIVKRWKGNSYVVAGLSSHITRVALDNWEKNSKTL